MLCGRTGNYIAGDSNIKASINASPFFDQIATHHSVGRPAFRISSYLNRLPVHVRIERIFPGVDFLDAKRRDPNKWCYRIAVALALDVSVVCRDGDV